MVHPNTTVSRSMVQILNIYQRILYQNMADKVVQKRRIRTDKQNRDYKCPCGKSYLSYPALYTHLKQKHGDEMEDYFKRIEKPQTTTLERGRPKAVDKVKTTVSQEQVLQYSLLTILENLTIELVDLLKATAQYKNKPVILVGNANLSYEEVARELQPIKSNEYLEQLLKPTLPEKRRNFHTLCLHFCRALCKHFTSEVSAKLILFFSILMRLYAQRYGYGLGEEEEEINTRFFNDFMMEMFERQKNDLEVSLWDQKIYKKILQGFGNWMFNLGYASSRVEINQQE